MQDHEALYIMDPSRVRDHSGRSYQIANYELDWRDVLDGIRTILANRREWVAHDSEWYEVGKSERHGFELRKQ